MYEVYVGPFKGICPQDMAIYCTLLPPVQVPEMVIDKAFLVNVMWLLRAAGDTNILSSLADHPTSSNWLASVLVSVVQGSLRSRHAKRTLSTNEVNLG